MMIIGLLLFAAGEPAGLSAEADAANLAFTQCLFATSRAASEARLSAGTFEQRLATACPAEQRAVERAIGEILALRGDRNAAASARQVSAGARQRVIDNYRRTLDLEP